MAGAWDSFTPDNAGSTAPDAWSKFVPDTPSGGLDKLSPAAAEVKRKAVEGGGTDMSDPLIENATIGIATAGMGVPLGMGYVPKTIAGKLLSAPVATAEQYLYGWASEKGAQAGEALAGTPGAVIGSLAGGAVAATGEAGIANRLARLGRLPAATEQAAQRAATGAEHKLYEEAPEDIYKYGQDVGKAQETAKADIGKTLKSSSDKAAPEIAAGQMTQFFGRTRAETEAARTMPIEDLALHRANMRKVVFGPINRLSEQLGKQFEVATKDQLPKSVDDLDALSKTVADEQKWLGDRGADLSKPVRDLMASMPSAEPTSIEAGRIQEVIAGRSAPSVNARFEQLMRQHEATRGQAITTEQMRDYAVQALGGPGPSNAKPTVGQLLGLRSEASRLVASQTDHNQAVAMRLREGIDQTLLDNGVQIPPELREQWATYKSMFDPAFRRNVATAVNPVGYGRKLFDNPERALTIIRGATPDEKQSLQQLAADYIRSATDPFKRVRTVSPAVLHELFGDSPYRNFKPWLETDHKALAWEQFQAGNRLIQQLVTQGAQEELKGIRREYAKDVAKAGIALARQLGPAGRGKLEKILSSLDPVKQAEIVEKEFPVNPQQAQEIYRQAQLTPGREAFQNNVAAKKVMQGLDINATREQAAVGALMKDPTNATMANLKRRLFAWHLPMLLAGAMAGGGIGSHYQLGISGMIVGMMAANRVRDMFRIAISDPAAARAYWRAIEARPTGINARLFGARMARVATAVALKDQNQEDAGATP